MYSVSDLEIDRIVRLATVLLLLAGCAAAPPSGPEPAESDDTPEISTPELAAKKPSVRLTIAAVGDMMLGTDYPENHLPDDDGVGFLAAVTPILSAADVTFGNLEGVLVDGGKPGKRCGNPAACFRFLPYRAELDLLGWAEPDIFQH